MSSSQLGTRSAVPPAPRRRDIATLGAWCVLAGPLIALAGGRWGTYVGIPGTPVFITDLLFAVGVTLMLIGRLRQPARITTTSPSGSLVASSVCFGAVLVIGLWSADEWSLNTVRDAAPFVYLLAVPLYVAAWRLIGLDQGIRAVIVATSFHTLWFSAAVFNLLPPVDLPGVGIPVFTTRGDFDGIVCGVNIALLVISGRRHRTLKNLVAVLAAVAMVAQGSRAGLVGGLVVLVFAAFVGLRWVRLPRRRASMLLAAGHFAFAGLVLLLLLAPSLPGWARGLQRAWATDLTDMSAQNTTTARYHAWALIAHYVDTSSSSRWFGHGFGSDVVMDSGALSFLSGNASVRAAHSFFFTWLGFTGWLGVALATVGIAAILLACLPSARRDAISAVSVGVAVALVAASLIGVLLESPFGYLTLIFFAALTIASRDGSPHCRGRPVKQSATEARHTTGSMVTVS